MNTVLVLAVTVIVTAGVTAGIMSTLTDTMPGQTRDSLDDTGNVSPALVLEPSDTPLEPSDTNVTSSANDKIIDVQTGSPVAITSDDQLADLLSTIGDLNMGMDLYRSAMSEPVMMFDDLAAAPAVSPRLADSSTGGLRESGQASESKEYSTTNVQVRGVDEPDYMKNDGQYAYIATRNVLNIIDVWPASEMHVATKVALDIDFEYIRDMFLNGDDLVVLYDEQRHDMTIQKYRFEPTRSYAPVTGVMIIDITDRESPVIRASYSIDGWLEDARMIGSYVYVVSTSPLDHADPRLPTVTMMPVENSDGSVNDNGRVLEAENKITSSAYYFADETGFSSFTTISAIDLSGMSDDSITSETFLMGSTSTYYVTHSNLYLTYAQHAPPGYDYDLAERDRFFNVIVPMLPDDIQSDIMDAWKRAALPAGGGDDDDGKPVGLVWGEISAILQNHYNMLGTGERNSLFEKIREALALYDSELVRDHTKTIIHKVSIDNNDIQYEARGSVPGRLLNQFSLGEGGGGERLRVATTVEHYTEFGGFERSNGVYALDAELNLVGALEDVAPDESIYSARFLGDRLYMVTFEQIDPFFVVDISADTPVILGELKIPGFSTYLHPYDDNHVIGIGRDTKLEDNGSWVRTLGVKVALFGVADVSNPVVVDDIIIGDSSVHSDALHDHRAFFFDGSRSMISMPIEGSYVALGDEHLNSAQRKSSGFIAPPSDYWSGFYILDVGVKDGLEVRGLIHHASDFKHYQYLVQPRTFYIEDVLYTVEADTLIASDIDSLEQLGHVQIAGTGGLINFME